MGSGYFGGIFFGEYTPVVPSQGFPSVAHVDAVGILTTAVDAVALQDTIDAVALDATSVDAVFER